MFNLDKIIEESNKERLYGKKPSVPEELEEVFIIDPNERMAMGKRLPNNKEIMDKINEIIKYLQWLDK